MKGKMISGLLLLIFLAAPCRVVPQIKFDLKKKIERKAEKEADDKADKAVKKGVDKIEEGVSRIFKKKDVAHKVETGELPEGEGEEAASISAKNQEKEGPLLQWSKYDFVPGDKVIFEDNLTGEENGEFPSRWDLADGTVEIAVLDGENVIMFREYGSTIIPYMQHPESDYLPGVFTMEFDAWIPHDHIQVLFYDMKNQDAPHGSKPLYVTGKGMELDQASGDLPEGENLEKQWVHVAMAYTSGKMKAYLNDTRLINIPHLAFDPVGISVRALHAGEKSLYYVKNIRLAEGGVKYYDRFLQDGKIIASGIRFDVNKATLKPESMGILNEIASLMKEHPEINFSVEGHTDSDGDDAFNQTLSEQRAGTVVSTLREMGINSNRLIPKGWGESKPLDTNGTPEGRANNRRVEFVKK
jgi:outer membrane protein OmpA-like peptidoglycan-associated protein